MQLNSVETCGKSKKKWQLFNFVVRYVDGVIEYAKLRDSIRNLHESICINTVASHKKVRLIKTL